MYMVYGFDFDASIALLSESEKQKIEDYSGKGVHETEGELNIKLAIILSYDYCTGNRQLSTSAVPLHKHPQHSPSNDHDETKK